ncbi:hypothetical protein F3J29_18885, partial [Enterobacter sp. Cy-643]|nr:hypothetical protein [Enterobacter sp. Cy-643]
LQNGDDLVFGESGFAHGDLLRGHNQYAGRSLNVNGPVCRDAYIIKRGKLQHKQTRLTQWSRYDILRRSYEIISRLIIELNRSSREPRIF